MFISPMASVKMGINAHTATSQFLDRALAEILKNAALLLARLGRAKSLTNEVPVPPEEKMQALVGNGARLVNVPMGTNTNFGIPLSANAGA